MGTTMVNYHDAVVYTGDEELFEAPNWLHDRCINFYFRYLEHEEFKDRPDLLFLDPAVVSCMMIQCTDEEELKDLSQGLNLESKSIVFIPINDSEAFYSGCTHWSLLVTYMKNPGVFLHYDSFSHHNQQAAKKTAAKFWAMQRQAGGAAGGEESLRVEQPACPQQENGYDCGMYVLTIAKYLAHLAVIGQEEEKADSSLLSRWVTPDYILESRRRMGKLVEGLIKTESKG